MARSKPKREMGSAGQSQKATEKTTQDKFKMTEELRHKPTQTIPGRISPQVSCTVSPEDKQILNELTLYLSNKAGRILNTSVIIRALIRNGQKHKEELET